MNQTFNPSELTISKFRFYSSGLVAENKKLTSNEIEVTPVEDFTSLDGEITSNIVDYKSTGVDANGRTYTSNVKTKITIKAQWLPMGNSNRITSPDVRRGELVMIYQFGDSDKYYWTTLKQDNNLRKLETVIYAFSGTTNESETLNADNSYYLEISTHTKLVTFHTSKSNGEPYSYTVQINTGSGNILVTDDIGNIIELNSKEDRVYMKNSSGSTIDITKDKIFGSADSLIELKTKKFLVNAPESILNGTVDIGLGLTGGASAQFSGAIDGVSVNASSMTSGLFTGVFSGPHV